VGASGPQIKLSYSEAIKQKRAASRLSAGSPFQAFIVLNYF
jgi:hypothetical protein